jgi:hypothetical protein
MKNVTTAKIHRIMKEAGIEQSKSVPNGRIKGMSNILPGYRVRKDDYMKVITIEIWKNKSLIEKVKTALEAAGVSYTQTNTDFNVSMNQD